MNLKKSIIIRGYLSGALTETVHRIMGEYGIRKYIARFTRREIDRMISSRIEDESLRATRLLNELEKKKNEIQKMQNEINRAHNLIIALQKERSK